MEIKNKKVLIVGGTKGLGLSMAHNLCQDNTVYIAGRSDPKFPNVKYIFFDARYPALETLPKDIDLLIVSCGAGKISKFFEQIDYEIKNQFQVNCIAPILLIKKYYNRLINDKTKIIVITSINSYIVSPLFSVYGASKTALSCFVSSLNEEMEQENCLNKITNVVSTYIDGTSFYGEITDLEKINHVTKSILDGIENNSDFFYYPSKGLCLTIIEKYKQNTKLFAKDYYEDKKNRLSKLNNKPMIVGYLSGSFDYLHLGHINIIKEAKKLCDYLVVGVHKDGSHKNKTLHLSLDDRIETIKSITYVDEVIIADREDTDTYNNIKYNILFVGDDYKNSERFNRYESFFQKLNVKIVYLPYTNIINSTEIRKINE